MSQAEDFLKKHLRSQEQKRQTNPGSSAGGLENLNVNAYPSQAPRQRKVGMWEANKRFWTTWTFEGRASRSEYWFAFLAQFLLAVPFILAYTTGSELLEIPYLIFGLLSVFPRLALDVRRLHDIGKSGWWIFLNFSTFGGLILFIWALMPSEPHPNQYGDVPNVV